MDTIQSEAGLETIFHSSKDAFVVLNQLVIVDANSSFSEMSGLPVTKLKGKYFLDFIKIDVQNQVETKLLEQEIGYFNTDLINIKGIGIAVQLGITVLFYKDMMLLHVRRHDKFTRQSVKNLQESESNYRTLFETSSDAILLLNLNECVDCNNALLKLFACNNKKDLIGKHPSELSPPFQADGCESYIAAEQRISIAFRDGKHNFEWLHRKLNGDVFPAEVSLTAMVINGKKVIHGVVRDISTRKKVETALLESEALWRSLTESSLDFIMLLDLDGTIRFINYTVPDLTKDQVYGTSVFMYIPEEYHQKVKRCFDEVITSGKPGQYEVEYIDAQGETHYFHTLVNTVKDKDNVVALIQNSRDISDRKRTERALIQNEANLRALLHALPDIIFQVNHDGFFTKYHIPNNTPLAMPQETFIGKNVKEIFPEFFSKKIFSTIRKVHHSNEIEVFEHQLQTISGLLCDVEVRFSPISNTEVLVMVRDITERKEAEKELQSSRLYSQNLDSISLILANNEDLDSMLMHLLKKLLDVFDVERAWLLYPCDPNSESWSVPFEATRENFPGSYAQNIQHKMSKEYANIARQALDSNTPITHDFSGDTNFDKSDYYSVKSQMTIALHPNLDIPWMMGLHVCRTNRQWSEQDKHLFQDIAQRSTSALSNQLLLRRVKQELEYSKQVESDILTAKNEAERANRAKSEFLARMSHELRTPLNAILGFGQLLQLEEINLNQVQKENVKEILEGGNHLLHLINEILDIAKVDAGEMKLQMEKLNLNQIISNTSNLLKPLADRHNVLIDLQFNPDIIIWIKADIQRVKQVLVNLLSNAIKYNVKHGSVNIQPVITADDKVRIQIIDTGIGIKKEDQPKLFEPFKRVGNSTSQVEGTGIGLTISQKLMHLMRGDIGFESHYGRGSTFWIEFPLQAMPESTDYYSEETGVLTSTARHGTSIKIVYIEDNPASIRLMKQLIKHLGKHELKCASTAKRGISLAKKQQPDLIILDIDLPDISGLEAMKRLQSDSETTRIPVIALSALSMPIQIEKAMKVGFSEYLTKPVKLDALQTIIDRTVNNKLNQV